MSPLGRSPQGLRTRSGVVAGSRRRFAMLRNPRESAARCIGPGRCSDMMAPPISALVEEPNGCRRFAQAPTPSGVVSVKMNRRSCGVKGSWKMSLPGCHDPEALMVRCEYSGYLTLPSLKVLGWVGGRASHRSGGSGYSPCTTPLRARRAAAACVNLPSVAMCETRVLWG
jgi:hypothetical protein